MFVDKLKWTSLDEWDELINTLRNWEEELKKYERLNKLK